MIVGKTSRDSLWVIGSLGTSQLFAAGYFALSARGAGAAAYGQVMAVVGVGMTVAGLLDFGSSSLSIRELAAGRMTMAEYRDSALTKLSVSLALGILAIGFSYILIPASVRLTSATAAFAVMTLANMTCLVPLRARGMQRHVAAVVVSEKAVSLAVILTLLLVARFHAYSLPWVLCLSLGISSVLSTWFVWGRLWSAKDRAQPFSLTNPWVGTSAYGVSSVVLSLQSLDIAILGRFASGTVAGQYAAVNRWTAPLVLTSTGYTQAMVPHIARASTHYEARRLLWRGSRILLIGVVGVVGVYVWADDAVSLILGVAYQTSVDTLRVLAVATLFTMVNQPLYMVLQARGFEKKSLYTILGSIPLQLALVGVLGSQFGSRGAAWGLVVAQSALCVMLVFLVIRMESSTQVYERARRE